MVTKFTIAARQPRSQGQEPPALWFTVEVWGQAGAWIADNLQKGEGAYVSGRLALQTWTVPGTGEVREALTVKNATVEKLWAPREVGAAQAAAPAQQAAPAAAVAPAAAPRPAAAPSWTPSSSPVAGSPFDIDPPF